MELAWTPEVLTLREQLHADVPELGGHPFLMAVADDDVAVHLHLSESPPRGRDAEKWATITALVCVDGRWERAFPGQGAHASGIDVDRPPRVLLDELTDLARRELPGSLRRPPNFVAPADRAPLDAEHVLPPELLVAARCPALDPAPLERTVGDLPRDYLDFLPRYGDARVNGFVRVWGPERVLAELPTHRRSLRWHFHWKDSEASVDRRLLAESVPLADTPDGALFVSHPDQPTEVIVLPRNAVRAEAYAGFWTAVRAVVDRRVGGDEGLFWVEPRSGLRVAKGFPVSPDAAGLDELRELIRWLDSASVTHTVKAADERSETRFMPAHETWVSVDGSEGDPDDATLYVHQGARGGPLVERFENALRDYGWLLEWQG
ncbi:MAG: hypothetical protein AAF447_14425 [Myxococcota bacterium]